MKWIIECIIVAVYLVFAVSMFYRQCKGKNQEKIDEAEKAKVAEAWRLNREKFKKEMEDKEREFEMELAEEDARFELLQAKSKAIKRRKILLKIMANQPTS